jgi:nitrogen-specific signal transduction histidine kinase
VTVSSDRRAVQQILMNLVHNAIKFTNNGTVLVRLAGRWWRDLRHHQRQRYRHRHRQRAARCAVPGFSQLDAPRCASSRAPAWACI